MSKRGKHKRDNNTRLIEKENSKNNTHLKKRGISTIVATVLLVLITVVTVIILWGSIFPLISQVAFTEDVNVRFKIDPNSYTFYNSTNHLLSVRVTRGADEADISAIKFIINDGGNTIEHISSDVPSPNSAKVYKFIVGEIKDFQGIKVIPIYNVNGNSREASSFDEREKIPNKDISFNDFSGAVGFGVNDPEIDSLSDGLVLYYPFDSEPITNGTDLITLDYSGSNYYGFFQDADNILYEDNGAINGAYHFDGSISQHIDANNTRTFMNGWHSFSYSVWVKLAQDDSIDMFMGKRFSAVFGKWGAGDNDLYFNLNNVADANYKKNTQGGDVLVSQGWTHFAMVYNYENSGKVTLYRNGEIEPLSNEVAGQYTLPPNDANPFRVPVWSDVCSTPPNCWAFNGYLDDVRVYNRVLTEEEIKKLYKMGEAT